MMAFFTTSDGVKIHYELLGEGERVIALLNGIAMNTAGWGFQTEALKKAGFRVLLHDMLGQGSSEKPRGEYSLERHVLDLKELLDHLGIEKASLVGISYGGKVALLAALLIPSYIDKLVVLNSSHTVDRALIARVDRWILGSRLKSGRVLWQIMVPDIFSDQFINERFSLVSSLAPNFELIDFVAFEEMAKAFVRVDLKGKLSSVRQPTLVVAGAEDRFFPPRYSEMIAGEIPSSRYLVLECGHVSIWEKPQEVNKLLLDFL
ncbi:MAG: alpha/beta hydrolase [Thermofilum sp.]